MRPGSAVRDCAPSGINRVGVCVLKVYCAILHRPQTRCKLQCLTVCLIYPAMAAQSPMPTAHLLAHTTNSSGANGGFHLPEDAQCNILRAQVGGLQADMSALLKEKEREIRILKSEVKCAREVCHLSTYQRIFALWRTCQCAQVKITLPHGNLNLRWSNPGGTDPSLAYRRSRWYGGNSRTLSWHARTSACERVGFATLARRERGTQCAAARRVKQ